MKNYEDLTIQISVLKKSINLGKILQNDYPEIAGLYREGYSLSKIIDELNIESVYAIDGIQKAIIGHNGSFRIEAYEGLISKEERKKIEKERKQESQTKFSKMGRYW